ncbi:uncharacterized protein LOC103026183 [Astyanax mexicanus]|uniref:uncharacterized protein LOC103026183 n=1 Tax=Astyanax mexicanus TaxID=7994 RepID=UPI0020CAC545|nr:uncharacterized protein LOC103026183 [Astyanax mexicanus]
MDETPEITEGTSSMQPPYQKKEQRIKSSSNTQTHTSQSYLLTVEHDEDDRVTVLSLSLLQRSPSQMTKVSEELRLIDLEEEEQEEKIQMEADAKAEMFIKRAISGILEKPIGTKVANRGSMQYSRGKVGKSLYQSKTEFDLRDPHMQQMPVTYSSLHDKHLKKFFNKPGRRKQLIDQGLITEDGHVLCSQKEFNQYIDYQKYIKPKKGELPLQDTRPPCQITKKIELTDLVEEEEEEVVEEVLTSSPSKDDILAGLKKIKIFFKKAWMTVKRAFTSRRRPSPSPSPS